MDPYLDPINSAFASAAAQAPQPQDLGHVAARQSLEEVQQPHEPAVDVAVESFEVPGNHGTTSVMVWRPSSSRNEPRSLVFFAHGGGWILGSPTVYAPVMEDLARESGAAMVFPYYTPAPDKQYPFQFEQTYEVLEYIVRKGRHRHNLLTESVILAGDSAGGHFVIALMQMALERGLTARIPHLILFNPVTSTNMKMKSYETFKNGPFLTAATMDWFIDAFIPNESDRENALTSPLQFAPDEVLRKFPPTLIVLADMDPLVDEGRAFADRLQKAGVDTAVIRAVEQVHGFFLFKPTRHGSTARIVVEMVGGRIRKAFAE